MCELSQRASEGVVFLVVHGILEVVALADGMFAMAGVGFVVVEVDFAEESSGVKRRGGVSYDDSL